MHVLMLGWEFPPFITGGLGTACHGLTKGLDRRGVEVTFVLPKAVDRSHAEHVNLVSPQTIETPASIGSPGSVAGGPSIAALHSLRTGGPPRTIVAAAAPTESGPGDRAGSELPGVRFIDIPAGFSHPYSSSPSDLGVGEWIIETAAGQRAVMRRTATGEAATVRIIEPPRAAVPQRAATSPVMAAAPPPASDYGMDLMQQVERYAHFCVAACRHLQFDLIHAHDWLTYPAGLALAQLTGRPLVVHIHSTEFDRSGMHVNQRVYDLERRGMHGAMRVIAVSQLTKNVVVNRYAVPERRVEVVYNGVELDPTQKDRVGIGTRDKIVLYFGRITYQKGPEYFIAAAKRVLDVMDNVKFVVAGSGDQAKRMIEMAAEWGIGHKVLFTGFLRGNDIRRVFALADLYVMPSVSEPFGIAPLEAMGHDVPVLISKTSGVSEVLSHALKCDFWDIDDMANKIVAVLRYPPLGKTLREHGAFEVRKLTWDGAAHRCEQVYQSVIGEMRRRVAAPA
jgi:glycosyltransferase involved in cell wall biosynthesis